MNQHNNNAKSKDYIYILGGGMVKDKEKWRTMRLDEGTKLGALGDRLRVEATYVLYKNNPELLFLSSGSKGMYKDIQNAPTGAELIKTELIELGIPKNKIFKEDKSVNTWQQLQKLKEVINKENLSHAYILSNRYHLPRIKTMIEKDNKLNILLEQGKIELISAEEILIESDPDKWKEKIDKAYAHEQMKKRISMEEKGVKDINSGKYKLK